MDFDLRVRTADDIQVVGTCEFHTHVVPEMLEQRGELAARAFRSSGLTSITIGVEGDAWTWSLGAGGTIQVTNGDPGSGARADLTAEWFSDIVNDLRSTVAAMIAGSAEMVRGNITHLVAWEPVLRALLDGRPAHEPGLVDFKDLTGAPLDLSRSFALDDDPAEIVHFLGEAGFLHIRGVFSTAEMETLARRSIAGGAR